MPREKSPRRGLCKKKVKNDIYTKGKILYPDTKKDSKGIIFSVKDHPELIIKRLFSTSKEYKITKLISKKIPNISPKVYGYYNCEPKSKNGTWNTYMVIEKFKGHTLLIAKNKKEGIKTIKKHFNEIWTIYQKLCKQGILFSDLYARNIILTPDNSIRVIDFGDDFSVNPTLIFKGPVPRHKRKTKAELKFDIIEDFNNWFGLRQGEVPKIDWDEEAAARRGAAYEIPGHEMDSMARQIWVNEWGRKASAFTMDKFNAVMDTKDKHKFNTSPKKKKKKEINK